MDKEAFFQALAKISNEQIDYFLHKYIFHGIPFVFYKDEEAYFDFRNRIATNFDISYTEIFIVGSARLGFSYFKNTIFTLESDVDVVIVNSKLFDNFFHKVTDFEYLLNSGEVVFDECENSKYRKFKDYLIKGWMRPDLIPQRFQLAILKNEWFDFFRSVSYDKSEVGDYKVAAGLFKDYYSLEKYYSNSLLKKKLEQETSTND